METINSNPMMFLLICFILLSCQVRSENLLTNQTNIFILAGQSNMAGRGGVYNDTATNTTVWDGVVPSECKSNPYILRLTANLVWVQAAEPLHADIDVNKTNGVGPGMCFANRVLNRYPKFGTVGLVPCAIGGTNISEWAKDGFLYEQTVARAKSAAGGGSGRLRAVLWYQGESDTVDEAGARSYKDVIVKVFTDLRTDLGNPLLPIIQVAIASGPGPFIDEVRKAQLQTNLPNVHCVDAKGLPLEQDGLHLTTSAQVRMGQMLADAFLGTATSSATFSESPASYVVHIASAVLFMCTQLL